MTDTPAPTPAPAPTPSPAPTPAPAPAWYEGKADQELIGHWDNKGWKKDDPVSIAIEASKQSRELQKHFGVPPDQLLKLPKADDEAGWKQVHQRLGAPADAKDYDFSTVKFNGTDLDPAFTEKMRAALHAVGVPKDKATALVKPVIEYLEAADKADFDQRAATLQAERSVLQKEWGQNFEYNKVMAQQGAKRLGVDPETVAKLEGELGYAKVMEMFRKVGAGTREDQFISTGGPNGMPTTRAGAVARREELTKDPDFTKRYLSGEPKAVQEMNALIEQIAGAAA